MKVYTTIEIRSAPEKVWEVLTDFSAYSEWNPFMIFAHGSAVVGSTLDLFIKPGNSDGMRFAPKVLVADPGKELRWLGHLGGIPGLFSGQHVFIITDLGDGNIRLEQSEAFSGLMVPILDCFTNVRRDTEKGFTDFNVALRARAEAS